MGNDTEHLHIPHKQLHWSWGNISFPFASLIIMIKVHLLFETSAKMLVITAKLALHHINTWRLKKMQNAPDACQQKETYLSKPHLFVQEAILTYNSRFSEKWSFNGLHYFFTERVSPEYNHHFFSVTMPRIIALALSLPNLIKKVLNWYFLMCEAYPQNLKFCFTSLAIMFHFLSQN